MTTNTTPRIDLEAHAAKPYGAMVRVERSIELDPQLKHLVKLRASFLNGCAFCIDMHWTDARARGEAELRLAQVAAWRESPFFDERERAALALTDAVTRVAETHVPDDVWAQAEAQFEPDELAHLLFAIAAINLWTRIAISSRITPTGYHAWAERQAAA